MRFFKAFITTALIATITACSPRPAPTATSAPTLVPSVTFTPLSSPTLAPTATALIQGALDHAIGTATPYITITMVSDFTCTACVDVALSMVLLRQKYPDDLQIVYRAFPNPADPKSLLAAQAAEAAYDQGKFWELHDLLYARQTEWLPLDQTTFRARLNDYAQQSGVPDLTLFNSAIDSGRFVQLAQIARQESESRGIKSAPALYFNDVQYVGRIDLFALESQTRLGLLRKRWFASAPGYTLDTSKSYTATLFTEYGDVVIELLPQQAPVTVNNFLFLARNGWFDDITFHQATDALVETGDPSGTGLGTAGYNIIDENTPAMLFDRPGLVAMAGDPRREDPYTGSSRFFITRAPLEPRPVYDGKYTIFGRIISGQDVIDKMPPRNPFGDEINPNPAPGVKLLRVQVVAAP